MSDSKTTVRYLGYRSLRDGGRGFDFSYALGAATPTVITMEAASAFFQGPERIALQEAAGICYETLKGRVQTDPSLSANRVLLTRADVTQHRRVAKPAGYRR